MSSRNFYTNNASTPIRSGALILPSASASTIASTSLRKNFRAESKYSNTSSERSRDSKNEAGPRGRTGWRTSDDVETRRRKTRREERKKFIKRHLESWGGDGRSQGTTKEYHETLITAENEISSDRLKKINKNESIASSECRESPEAVYPWEKPIELVRDHPRVVPDDLESIFDKPLPRLQDPRSLKKNETLPDDQQLVDSDDDFGWNDLAVGPIRTYPGPTKSGDDSHRVEKQINKKRHIRKRQFMLQMRRRSEEKSQKVDGSKRKKRQRRSSLKQTVRTLGRLGARNKSRIYDDMSSLEESSNDPICVFEWDRNRGKFVRRSLSPAKSLNWGNSAYYKKQNEVFDEMYREYEESLLPREKNKIGGGDKFGDIRAKQTLIRSRRKIDQEKIRAGRSSRSKKKKTAIFDYAPESFSSCCAVDLEDPEEDEPTSEMLPKNLQSKCQKKSFPIVENFPHRKSVVPSKDLIDLSVDSLDDDSPTKTYKRRKRRRRTNNFDLTVLQSFATDFTEKSRSNYHEDGDPFSGSPDHQDGGENASIVMETRSPEIPIEIKKNQRIEKSVNIFSKFKKNTWFSSDESTSAASTLIMDHTDHSILQSFERIPRERPEGSNRIARYRKKKRKLSSSSDTSNATSPSSLLKPTVRSIINLPKGTVKRCGPDRWEIHNFGNLNDRLKQFEPNGTIVHN